jgi:predicted lysophospholipase L1 biosynthesis ABC-type transport system permease subunit
VNVYDGPDFGGGPAPKPEVPAGTDVTKLDVGVLLVTAATRDGLEQARTYLATHVPVDAGASSPDQWTTSAAAPMTFGEVAAVRGAMYTAAERMIVFVVVLTLVVAGCSLAVATAGGLVERRRPFTLLRLAGTPVASLYRVVFLESALPLLGASAFAAVTGFAMARVAVGALAPDTPMAFPVGAYAATTAAGLVCALAVIAGSMTLLSRMTRSDTARFE